MSERNLSVARNAVSNYLVIGTFSENGPDKCSGLRIQKYNENQLTNQLDNGFKKVRCSRLNANQNQFNLSDTGHSLFITAH